MDRVLDQWNRNHENGEKMTRGPIAARLLNLFPCQYHFKGLEQWIRMRLHVYHAYVDDREFWRKAL